jgi:hypothetical protein
VSTFSHCGAWSISVSTFSHCGAWSIYVSMFSHCGAPHTTPLTPFSSSFKVKVKVTLRPTTNRSVRLGFEPHLGLMTRY